MNISYYSKTRLSRHPTSSKVVTQPPRATTTTFFRTFIGALLLALMISFLPIYQSFITRTVHVGLPHPADQLILGSRRSDRIVPFDHLLPLASSHTYSGCRALLLPLFLCLLLIIRGATYGCVVRS